jgi:hypothetical protein
VSELETINNRLGVKPEKGFKNFNVKSLLSDVEELVNPCICMAELWRILKLCNYIAYRHYTTMCLRKTQGTILRKKNEI